ncbi:DMT family transporter [Enterovirga sp.]|uniref:DMT family transporter n=1 Tax=Enterovirga sp. TaxID=2026350 RepID=UPI002C07E9F7|nr:DMT family transporter [Enterovirga sp.]HMO28880.1 DMT family transporter [Enterovirga sp.]
MQILSLAVPLLFVFIWATGFVVARLVAPHVEPMTFLAIRFAFAGGALGALALIMHAPWPTTRRAWGHAIGIGLLLQGVYLGGVFWAVRHGLPAGIVSLVVSLQPLLTALVARRLLGERVPMRRRIGIAIGFAGVALVLAPKLGGADGYSLPTLLAAFGSLLTITVATIWQKRAGGEIDFRAGTAIQFGASALLMLAMALATETMRIDPAPGFWIGLFWAVFGLSIGAIFLLFLMIRRGAVVSVAAWLFLVPPVAVLMSFALFGETLSPLQIAGMAVATAGVALATRA